MWEEGTADQARKVDGTNLGRQQLTSPKASSSLEWTAAANSYCFNVALLATLDLRRSQSCRWALSLQNLARRCGFGCSCGPGRIHPVQRHLTISPDYCSLVLPRVIFFLHCTRLSLLFRCPLVGVLKFPSSAETIFVFLF